MKPIKGFFICYLFKGQSFSAQRSLQNFIENLEMNKEILDKFQEYHIKSQMIKLEELPILNTLIIESFFKEK
jgi:hypothetical protein